jgi:Co/Zn/Cd efflux system component
MALELSIFEDGVPPVFRLRSDGGPSLAAHSVSVTTVRPGGSRQAFAFIDKPDRVVDLHVWRLGPGHFGAVVSVISTVAQRGPEFYHSILRRFKGLSHITVEVHVQQ